MSDSATEYDKLFIGGSLCVASHRSPIIAAVSAASVR